MVRKVAGGQLANAIQVKMFFEFKLFRSINHSFYLIYTLEYFFNYVYFILVFIIVHIALFTIWSQIGRWSNTK